LLTNQIKELIKNFTEGSSLAKLLIAIPSSWKTLPGYISLIRNLARPNFIRSFFLSKYPFGILAKSLCFQILLYHFRKFLCFLLQAKNSPSLAASVNDEVHFLYLIQNSLIK